MEIFHENLVDVDLARGLERKELGDGMGEEVYRYGGACRR
jgi:hypothetical protein